MPQYWRQFIDAVEDVVKVAWPATIPNGIYHATQIATIPFQNKAQAGELPIAVLDFEMLPTGEYGATNRAEQGPVSFFLIQRDDYNVPALVEQAEALRTLLWPDSPSTPSALTVGQVERYPALAFGINLPMNQYFLDNQQPCIGAVVVASIVVGAKADA